MTVRSFKKSAADAKADSTDSRKRPPAGIVREQFAASIVLVLGTALSVIGFLTAQQYFRSGEQQEFDRQAAHYIQTVVNSAQRYEEYILDLARRFEGPAPMDRWQFDDYSTDRLERYKGLLSLAWIPFVSADRRGEFEAKAHDDGLFG
ncbi:MAG: CHASE domain-containing protein, partial [Alphaproteobacteria bacterium]|nr:CHASE domain-containing protein [Alphaproteobacteria bacterium]